MPFDPIAKKVYDTKEWKECRAAYVSSVGGRCEECMSKGIYSVGQEVHHKVKLTLENADDPSIAYNFDNLELLCRKCHSARHRKPRGYIIDEFGHVTLTGDREVR